MGLFDYRFKLPLHIVELILIIAVCGLSAARLFLPGVATKTRANTIALGFSAKSINFIFYQLLTDHVQRLRRWRSLKAYTILNGLEIVFWAAVVFLLIQANISVCVGVGCTLSWVVVGLSISLSIFSAYAFCISFVALRQQRAGQRDGRLSDDAHELRHEVGHNRYSTSVSREDTRK
ncbi:putative cytochrome p450 [Diaporthe ampelina]|uniref:Putative cytochrome p450 n=1 Tax=Diaporthe ampelina TaxID=1214573 RepID=A0A0G2HSB2_9PEZI|nr:putative cytochrome p450 [Diaporthe ampelina]